MTTTTRRVNFTARDGPRLEGVLHLPAGEGPFPAVVVCHPHPQMGGNMGNGIVVTLCLNLAVQDWVALRFNFRGVGDSEGAFAQGRGEMEDAAGGVDFLVDQPEVDPDRLALAGYSFGAAVAVRHFARDQRLQKLVAIALPEPAYEEDALDEDPRPALFIAGEKDPFAPAEALRAYVDGLRSPKKLRILPETDHFFGDQKTQLARIIVDWL